VFDGSALTDNKDALNSVVNLDGISDFVLRRMMGMPSVSASMIIKDDANHQPLSYSASGRGQIMQNNYAMAQQWRYRKDGHIYFDLFSVLRQNTACGGQPIFTSFLGLQGAQIVNNQNLYQTPYDYQGFEFSLELSLNLNWFRYTANPGPVDIPRTFYIEIVNYDFELQQICITNTTTAAAPFIPNTTDFLVMLFDTYQNQLFSSAVPIDWINSLRGNNYQSIFPVPTITYQRNSQLRLDITSMLCNGGPAQTYQISLKGVRRLPT
jgi:hypothetical protein